MAIPQRTRKEYKAPGDAPRFGWDWSDEFAELGDTIASVANVGTGVTVTGETHTDTQNVFRVSGGTASTEASVVSTVTTTGGDTLVAEWKFHITAT